MEKVYVIKHDNGNINAVGYETLLNGSVAVADGSWQTLTTTVNLSNAKYIIMVAGPHGALNNELVIPIGTITNVGLEHRLSAYWNEGNLGEIRLDKNGKVEIHAKTRNIEFDYKLYKAV